MRSGRRPGRVLTMVLSASALTLLAGYAEAAPQQIDVASAGYAVTADPATGTVFQADPRARVVRVLRTMHHGFGPVATIPAGPAPSAVAFDSTRQQLQVADPVERSITTISRTTSGSWSRTATTRLDFAPAAVAVDPASGAVHATRTPPTTSAATPLGARSATLTRSGSGYTVTRGDGFLRIRSTTSNTEFCLGTCTDVAVGADGVNGGDGGQGGIGYCVGTCTNVGSGGTGGAAAPVVDENGDVVATGGRGGAGGTGYCLGRCTNIASGGVGGAATATGTTTGAGDAWSAARGQDVRATGGTGGTGGTGVCWGSCTSVGAGGVGGDAIASGGDGVDAGPESLNGGRGGSATAFGGLGGSQGWGTCNDVFCSGLPAPDGTGTATGGRGGDGANRTGDGFVGGGYGGFGGYAQASGDGATAIGGDGGRGGRAGSLTGDALVVGGNGGDGGSAGVYGVDSYSDIPSVTPGTATGGRGGDGGTADGPAQQVIGGRGGEGGTGSSGSTRPPGSTATGGDGGRGGDAGNDVGESRAGDGGRGGALQVYGDNATGVSGNGGDGGSATGAVPGGGRGGAAGEVRQSDNGATAGLGRPGVDGRPRPSAG